jgi:hypothetical protein
MPTSLKRFDIDKVGETTTPILPDEATIPRSQFLFPEGIIGRDGRSCRAWPVAITTVFVIIFSTNCNRAPATIRTSCFIEVSPPSVIPSFWNEINQHGRGIVTKRISLSFHTLTVGLISLTFVDSAPAQFYVGGSNAVGSGSSINARGVNASDPGAGPAIFSYNPSDSNGGGGSRSVASSTTTHYGAWIQAADDYWVVNAIARQQAFLQGKMQYQDVEVRRLQLRRAAFDQMLYEKMNAPPREFIREEARLQRLDRARNAPPRAEIVNGDALNELLDSIQRFQARDGVPGAILTLSPATLSRINVTTTGNSSGSNEFFKPGGFPNWPQVFAAPVFDSPKKRLQSDLVELANAQLKGKIDFASAADAKRSADAIKARLFEIRTLVAFNDYVAASAFLSKLSNTIETLSKPGAGKFLDGTYAAKGNNVAELVEYLISKGLKFAQATPGHESDYLVLYQQLAAYELGLSRATARQTSLPEPPQPSFNWPWVNK